MTQDTRHPFLDGLSRHRGAPPTIVIIFGASGDLTRRKLLPAVYNLKADNLLPISFYLIGFGRKEITDDSYREEMDEAISSFSRRKPDTTLWNGLKENLYFHNGDYSNLDAYNALKHKIEKIQEQEGKSFNLVFYISTPPTVFSNIIENLGKSGLSHHQINGKLSARIIIEKPFGKDLTSAKALNSLIKQHFDEEQIYRIDHYLGKETVQNLLVQRFANSIFEPIWNREYVASVQITVAEQLGVGKRGGYYDRSGALRDMIQNHTMQLLALTAMEPPVSLDPESIRDEKVKVLKAIQPLCVTECECGGSCNVVRGRYDKGIIDGENVPAYLDEEHIAKDSITETYAALKLSINNWRWKGVPFYLRSGKRMPKRVTEIAVQFKRPPGVLFQNDNSLDLSSNTLSIQVQPDEGMTLTMNSKVPGLETRTQPVKLHFHYKSTFGSNTPEAYERLILDAIVGDSTLFIRGDETEASWKLITPILDCWKAQGNKELFEYPSGSWGPEKSNHLLKRDGFEWRRP